MAIFQRLNREQGITDDRVTHEPDIAHYAQRIITFQRRQRFEDAMNRSPSRAMPSVSWRTAWRQEEEEPS